MIQSQSMSLMKSFKSIFSEEKDEGKTRYINIQLLCKSLWKTHQFDFDKDVVNVIPNHFGLQQIQ